MLPLQSEQDSRPTTECSRDRGKSPIDHPPLVDCHAHIFDSTMPVMSNAWIAPDYGFSANDLIALLDDHGVHFGVISGLSITGYYNDYMLAQLRNNRRLRGTVIVPPSMDRFVLERMRESGIVGIRLQLARQRHLDNFRSDEWKLMLRRVRDLGWHVHVAIEGPQLRPVLDALRESGVDIVVDHFGHPDPADPTGCDSLSAMFEAVDGGHTWIKLSGGYRLPGTEAWRDPEADLDTIASMVAAAIFDRVGTDRLLWGSDAPFVGYERRVSYSLVLQEYARWIPDAAKRNEIDRTALQFYFS